VPERLGMMISYVRFMFMAMHRGLFRNEVVAELLPPLLPDGTSHLWESLGRKFTDMTYTEADRLSKRNKEFIKSLFPSGRHLRLAPPRDAQAVVGKVGRETLGVEKMLRRIGFHYCNRIDPFDGGPHFRAATDEILLVKRSRPLRVRVAPGGVSGPKTLLAVNLKDPPYFRCVCVPALAGDNGFVEVEGSAAEFLGVSNDSEVWALPLD
jgi:arginine N-succinyltransferase